MRYNYHSSHGFTRLLVLGWFHRWEPWRRIMIWTVYGDEAGTHGGGSIQKESPVMAIGGFIARADRWVAFEPEWNDLLRRFDIPYSHAQEMMKRKGPFKDWDPVKCNSFVLGARHLINKHLEIGFSTVLRKDDYREFYKAGTKPKKLPQDTMYGVLFRGAVTFCLHALSFEREEKAKADTINFVMENGPFSGYATDLYKRFKKDRRVDQLYQSMLGPVIGFADKDDSAGCQVADLMLYAAYGLEIQDHGHEPSDIAHSSWADASAPYPTDEIPSFRLPLTQKILGELRTELLAEEEARRAWGMSRHSGAN